MYKRLVSIILSIALCMSILSTTVFADTEYDVWVNGEEFTSSKLSIQCGEGTAAYNPTSKELTLTNATIDYTPNYVGIHSSSDLKIVLVGNNSIVDGSEKIVDGIFVVSGNLTLTGTGNLSIAVSDEDCYGIEVDDGDLIIDMQGDLDLDTVNICIITKQNIDIKNCGNLIIDSAYEGIFSCYGDITISGSNDIDINAGIDGIHSEHGLVTLSGSGNINIKANDDGIEGESGVELNNTGALTINSAYGIYSSKNHITLKGSGPISIVAEDECLLADKDISLLGNSKITLTAPTGYGIDTESGDITISGSNDIDINAKNGIATFRGAVSITGKDTIFMSCTEIAIYSNEALEINHEGMIDINSFYGIESGSDIHISGKGSSSISAKDTSVYVSSGNQLIIEDAGEVTLNSSTSNAIYFADDTCTATIKGEVGQLILTSADTCSIISDDYGNTYSLIVEKPELYDVTGSDIEDRLTYTLKVYSVSFDMGGHGTAPEEQIVKFNNKATKPSDPVATGYKFDGWYTDKNCTKAFDFTSAITADTTLYAKWTCLHANTEIKNKKDATTTSTGYTGDTYCKDCGVLISSGAAIPTLTPAPTAAPTSAPTTAPELNVGDFINRCYSVALGRSADEAGYNYWVDNLNNGQACGAQVGYGFIFSQEYINKNRSDKEFVTDMYAMYFGREADADGFNYWVSLLESGLTREDIMAGFANSEEFYNLCNKYGVVCGTYLVGVPNDVQGGVNCFVARLYKVCLNRLPDMGGQAGWVLKLMNGEVSGTSAAYGFVFSPEFIGKNPSNEDFVNYMYAAFFGREADEAGFNAWVDVLNGGGSYEDVFNGFTGSAEFFNLCASYGIQA
ncbi:MAG: DUF4214 domain-containing protein [Clostridia bacterium]|nr:DUF4214 domain-containing protein [Clostridia bacterium]